MKYLLYIVLKLSLNILYFLLYIGILLGIYTLIIRIPSIIKFFIRDGKTIIKRWNAFFHGKFQLSEIISIIFLIALILFSINPTIKIWKNEIDIDLTLKSIYEKFSPDKIIKLISISNTLIEKPFLDIEIEIKNAHLINLMEKQKEWDKKDMKDKKQYLISIINKNPDDLDNVKLEFIFPFFIEKATIWNKDKLSGDDIEANLTKWEASQSLRVEKLGQPFPNSYTLKIHRISQGGIFQIIFILDNKAPSFPPNSQTAKNLKNSKCEFIYGSYIYKKKTFEIYYPIEIQQDKTIYLGKPANKKPPNASIVWSLR